MQRDGDVPVLLCVVCGAVGHGFGDSELDESGAAPLGDDPVWGLEVGGAGEAAEAGEVFGSQEEGVVELVFVDEEVRGECEMGVQSAGWVGWRKMLFWEGEGKSWMEACGVGKGCCVS